MKVERRCLLIEDSKTTAKIISDSLAQRGVTVMWSETVEGAAKAFAHEEVHCVLLDLVLQGIWGKQAVSMLRKIFPKTGLAAMTAGDSSRDPVRLLSEAHEAGADILSRKPFTQEALYECVDNCFSIAHGAARRGHVLLVEDSRTVLAFARMALVDAGFQVTFKSSMEEALTSLSLLHIDCVVTDVFMPGMGGLAGVAMLKRISPDLGVVVISGGLKDHMDKHQALLAAQRIGVADTLAKPFTAIQLQQKVRAVVQAAREAAVAKRNGAMAQAAASAA